MLAPSLQVVAPGQAKTRHSRTPHFPIAGTMKPFGLYPLAIHPVLPGETLNYAGMKWNVVSQPVKHPLAGAWLETWVMYVKLTDLDRSLGEMFVSDTYSTTGWTAGSNKPRYFTASGQIDWVGKCVDRIVEAYFVHENETARTIDGVPKIKVNNRSWYQNAIFRPAEVAVDTTDPFDMSNGLTGYQMMLQMSMTELTYEKYLEQFGVSSIRTSLGEPEILRYSRSWTLPANTIDAASGAPSSAFIWRDKMEASKPKRFDEPGFVVVLGAVRPKFFQRNLAYSMVGNLWGFSDFFPIYNLHEPQAGVKVILTDDVVFDPAANGVDASDELLYDHKDLLSHGEQFINTVEADHPYDLPLSNGLSLVSTAEPEDLRGEYVPDADIAAIFTSATATNQVCIYEGIVDLNIAGHITDTTR